MFWLNALFLTVLLSGTPSQALVLDRLEASVNDHIILYSDILEFRRTADLRLQLDPLFQSHPISKDTKKAGDLDVVQFLVNDRLIAHEFPVDDAKVEQEINAIQANNRITRNQLIRIIKEQGFSFDTYFEMIRSSLAKRQLIERDIRTKIYISDDDVKNFFYNEHLKPGNAASYQVKIITVSHSNYKTPAGARSVIAKAHQALGSGETFEAVAKLYSDGPTAQAGGDLGFLSPQEMNKEIRDSVKSLKVGQNSEIISGKNAFFILKLADIKTGQDEKLKAEREQIRQLLTAREYQNQIELWLERKKQQAFINLVGQS